MKPATKLLGLVGACAACCAIPILAPLVAGASLAGLAGMFSSLCLDDGVFTFTWVEAGFVLAAIGIATIVILRHRAKVARSTNSGGCGCGPVRQAGAPK